MRTDYLGPYQYEGDSLRSFPHAEGRVLRFVSAVSGAVRYEREYTLKDHLGNLRLAYRLGHRQTFTATLEPDETTRRREVRQFDSLSVSPPVAQAVGGAARTGRYVARLNAGGPAPQPLGPLKQLAVQKGDTVTVTAPGHYPQAVASSSFAFSLAGFVASLLQQPAGAPGADGRRRSTLPLLSIGVSAALPALTKPSGGVPQGYVRLLVFDADSNLVSGQVQTRQLSAAAAGGYEPLAVQVIAAQDGYVTAYVGNESNADVYFDDVQVTLGQGVQVQENSYDPYGLSLAGLDYASPGIRGLNKYQFNGKEQEQELGLGWQDFNWRHYDPATARFFGVDRLANKFVYMTDYQFASNNPTSKIELDGLEGVWAAELLVKYVLMPYINYASAYRNEAANIAEHNTQNSYTATVPADVRALNQQMRSVENATQAIDAGTKILETNLTLMSGLEAGAMLAPGAVRVGWEALADGPQVGRIANKIDNTLGRGTVKGVEQDYSFGLKGAEQSGDVDIATSRMNISVKTGHGKGSFSQAIKEAAYAKEQGKDYIFYATDRNFSGAAEKQMKKAGINVVRNDHQLLKALID